MQWFRKQSTALIGIDIGARYIKLIELNRNSGDLLEVSYFAIKELPMMVLTESNDIKDHATISATLTQLKNTEKQLGSQAAIALPGSSVVTKQIIIEASENGRYLEEQVWLEAGKHFPDLIEDLSLDFHVHGPLETDSSKLDVLLVACRKTSIEKRLDALTASHFAVQFVDVDYYALERTLRYQLSHQSIHPPEGVYALLNFNSRSSTLVVIQETRLLYAYDQSFDGMRLTQKLQQELHWPQPILHPEQLPNVLSSEAITLLESQLLGHIRHALQLFTTSCQESAIDHLFLAGDFAIIPTIDALLSQTVNIPTSIANPLIAMRIAATVDDLQLKACAPLLTLCCGLALQVTPS